MRGMSSTTGKAISGIEHLQQRLADVLTTPVGTRVMRRGYGSRLFELVDQSVDPSWPVKAFAATAEAVRNPINGVQDFALERVNLLDAGLTGNTELELIGVYLTTNEAISVRVSL